MGCVALIHLCLRSGIDMVPFERFGFSVCCYGERRCLGDEPRIKVRCLPNFVVSPLQPRQPLD